MIKHPTFAEYIKTYQDWFCIDKSSERLIEVLGLYANQDPAFEQVDDKNFMGKDQTKLYLEKGILLMGNVGTGKTTILRMLQKYNALFGTNGHPHQFRISSIPEMADEFSISGRAAFTRYNTGHWLMDELCFINEKTGVPDREYAINYGDKILIGEKIVYDRYSAFIEKGYRTHFATNATTQQFRDFYGERVYSRLVEMCNMLPYTGRDRRINARPHLYKRPEAVTYQEKKLEELPVVRSAADDAQFLQMTFDSYRRTRQPQFISREEFDILLQHRLLSDDLEPYLNGSTMTAGETEKSNAKRLAVAAYYEDLIVCGKVIAM